jgi:hypothetical protein
VALRISSFVSGGGGGTSPRNVPIDSKYIVHKNNSTVSLNNLIKQVKEHVRINFILIK